MAARTFELSTRLAPAALAARANETARCGDLVRIRATPEHLRAFVTGGSVDVPVRLRATVEATAEGSRVAGDVRPSLLIAAALLVVLLALGAGLSLLVPLGRGVWAVLAAMLLMMAFAWRRASRRLDDALLADITESVRVLVRPDAPNRAQRKAARRAGKKR